MKNIFSILLFLLLSYYDATAGTVNFVSSNLPIIIITTDVNPATGQQYNIVDEPKVPATMKIIYHTDGNRNFLTDLNNATYLSYNGKIGIEIRGSSSQMLEKKPYSITTYKSDGVSNNNVSIFGMPKENDWVLNALAFDGSLIRDYLSYDLYRNMGNYSTRQQYCEVIINSDYKGLYIFMEKLKIDENRINITKMSTSDTTYPAVTGGYVIKADKTTGGDPVAWTMNSDNGWTTNFIHDNPKPTEITSSQHDYIYNYFMDLKKIVDKADASITTGYPTLIDIPSFIDFMIMAELASNVDSYQYSSFFHKDRKGKLRAGPIWDFNLTYGLDVFGSRSVTDVWQFDNDDNEGPRFWKYLFNNPTYKCYLSKRWKELTSSGKPLSKSVIDAKIDNILPIISEAASREQSRWGNGGSYVSQANAIKNWISQRMIWLNEKLSNDADCANVEVPKLVISKINYHPLPTVAQYEDSLEFIEITNNSTANVNLTGIHFRELGLVYRFPNNAILLPNQKIYLSSDSVMFKSFYGLDAFGQFYRNLSNKTQRLTLTDAFGNLIDDVTYADSAPWVTEPDGGGTYLQLIDVNADNNVASNWKSSNLPLTNTVDNSYGNLILYPNPTKSNVRILGYDTVTAYEVLDITGRTLRKAQNTDNIIEISDLTSNVYLIKLFTADKKTVIKRIVKQ